MEGLEVVWKQVQDQEGARRGQEEVRKAMEEGRRGGKAWTSNGTLHQILKILVCCSDVACLHVFKITYTVDVVFF